MTDDRFTEDRILDEHAAKLRTIFKRPKGSSLPDGLVKWYWEYRRAADRIHLHLDDFALLQIAMSYAKDGQPDKNGHLIHADAKDFGDLIAEGKVEPHANVVVKFSGGEKPGKYLRHKADSKGKIVHVICQVGSEEYKVLPNQVQAL